MEVNINSNDKVDDDDDDKVDDKQNKIAHKIHDTYTRRTKCN